MRRPLRLLLVVLLMAFAGAQGQPKDRPKGAAPWALYALQLAADPGKTTKLTIRGVGVEAATEVRIGEPKCSGKVIGKGRKTPPANPMTAPLLGDSEIDVEVTLPAEVPGGVIPLSLVGPGGEGKPMTLLVNDDTPRLAEKEPNDGFREAMPITAPVVVEANFKQPQDVDVFRLDGRKGDRYRIEVQAGRYGSPADVMLTLYDADGRTVATGEVPPGGRDPVLRITLPKDGTFFISAIEGYDQGGSGFVYHLAVRREP
jgi:Bacterial pre-peptidase C-terminal domain